MHKWLLVGLGGMLVSNSFAYTENRANFYMDAAYKRELNGVIFNLESNCLGMAKQDKCYSIGTDSNWGGISIVRPGEHGIIVYADREGSYAPWLFISEVSKYIGLEEAPFYGKHRDNEWGQINLINFAMVGTLSWTNLDGRTREECHKVLIYQMMQKGRNLWFLGSNYKDHDRKYDWANPIDINNAYLTCANSSTKISSTYEVSVEHNFFVPAKIAVIKVN
jgi:hypothetical protein